MAETQPQKYDIERGPLAETYGLFVPSTINTGAQISVDRIADASLHGEWFYTANLPLATKRGGKLLFGMGGNSAFTAVFGRNTAQVCQELIDTGYIHLSPEQRNLMLRLEKSGEVIFVDPKDMKLKGQEDEYREFPIRTESYGKDVTVARMPFVQAGYGSGDMLRQVMDNLQRKVRIEETKVFMMSPDHAAEAVKDGEMVAQASRLDNFGEESYFDAVVRYVHDHDALRGVRQVVAVLERARGELLQVTGDAAPKDGTLDALVGKGTDVGNGLVVIHREKMSDEAYAALTRKQ